MDGPVDARLAGAVWGYLLGDALGVPYASLSAAEIARGETAEEHGFRSRPAGTWSDAGALMLAVLDSLLAVGFDPEDQAERILDWYRDGAYAAGDEGRFDADDRTVQAAHAIERGIPAEQCGPSGDDVAGGSAVKVALALVLADPLLSDDQLLQRARATARILDGRPRAAIATALYAGLVRETLFGSGDRTTVRRRVIESLTAACGRHEERGVLVPAARDVLGRGRRGRVPAAWDPSRPWDAVWTAFEVFLAADSPLAAIEEAVRLGNETDTTAALTGGLAGAFWGIESIPAAVLRSLRGRWVAGRLVDRLLTPALVEPGSGHLDIAWLDVPASSGDPTTDGQLGVAGLPGGDPDRHGRVRRRRLATDADHLASTGVTLLALLVMDHELEPYRADSYVAVLEARGVEVWREPVAELDVPTSRDRYRQVVAATRSALQAGRRVVVACGTGLGRSSTFAACVLREEGLTADAALAVVRGDRPRAIETAAQEAFVRSWR